MSMMIPNFVQRGKYRFGVIAGVFIYKLFRTHEITSEVAEIGRQASPSGNQRVPEGARYQSNVASEVISSMHQSQPEKTHM